MSSAQIIIIIPIRVFNNVRASSLAKKTVLPPHEPSKFCQGFSQNTPTRHTIFATDAPEEPPGRIFRKFTTQLNFSRLHFIKKKNCSEKGQKTSAKGQKSARIFARNYVYRKEIIHVKLAN